MRNIILNENIKIEDMIYEVRGKQVMLDSDLARLYQCANGTKDINKAVKRNIERFPNDFYFQLTYDEYQNLKFQIGTANKMSRVMPHVFTEQGVAMLSSVLHTDVAVKTSIRIINAFVAMRHYDLNSLGRISSVEIKVIDHDNRIKLLEESFNKLEEKREINEIYFNGKIYDAYSKVIDIFKEAKKELIVVDRYADKSVLDMIRNLDCKVILITSKNTKLTKTDIEKYNKSYNNLLIVYDETYHDRYFVIDKIKIYHSGNSINHIGYRKSSVNVLEDTKVKKMIIDDIKKIIG